MWHLGVRANLGGREGVGDGWGVGFGSGGVDESWVLVSQDGETIEGGDTVSAVLRVL